MAIGFSYGREESFGVSFKCVSFIGIVPELVDKCECSDVDEH